MNVDGVHYQLVATEAQGDKLALYTTDAALVRVILRARLDRMPLVVDGTTYAIAAVAVAGDCAEVRLSPLQLVTA